MNSTLYFDYCATTPVHPKVMEQMLPVLGNSFGNPSSLHAPGQHARELVSQARMQVAAGIGAEPDEITFTSGATEANNLALIGVMEALSPKKRHLITSSIEHHATLHTAEALVKRGYELTILPVDGQGRVSPEDLVGALRTDTGLVSVMLVNNEVGSLQDLPALSRIARQRDVLVHTDAVQALNCYGLDVDDLGVDLLSLSGHKIYGPKGIGALYVRKGTPIDPIQFGGAQEAGLRPGTENVPGIVGLGAAMALRNSDYSGRYLHMRHLREQFMRGLQVIFPDAVVNGPLENHAPHILSVSFQNVDGELLLFQLNQQGVAVSMGSACTSESIEPSHVLKAMGLTEAQIEGTIRISFGLQTTEREVQELLNLLPQAVEQARI